MTICSWGSNSHGQLGLGTKVEQILVPTRIELNIRVKCITGGGKHTVIVTEENDVFTCGDNSKGQLGTKLPVLASHRFQGICLPLKITQVTCGWDFTLAITEGNEVYGWGSNQFGQLGFPINKTTTLSTPTKVFNQKALTVSAGLRHSAIITSKGSLFTSGYCRKGQLGLPLKDFILNSIDNFMEVKDIKNCEQVSCGENHCIAKTIDNIFYSWGNNRYGQLALNPKDVPFSHLPIKITIPVDKFDKCQLHAGWAHNCLLTASGKVITWGRNDLSQLGHQKTHSWKPTVLTSLHQKIKQLSLGSHHCVALTDTNQVLTWGWNEHGNCGNSSTEDVKHPQPVTESPQAELTGLKVYVQCVHIMDKWHNQLNIDNPDSTSTWSEEYSPGISVVNNSLEYNTFFETFLLANRPCLMRNLDEKWACRLNWVNDDSLNVDFFGKRYNNVEVPVSNCGQREFNVQKKSTMRLLDYLEYWESYASSDNSMDCLYLKDWHFFMDFPEEDVYRVPRYFASDWLNEYYKDFPNLKDDYRFVYIGPKGSWTPFHADVFTSFSWSVNICGRKKWLLMPPGAEKHFTDDLGNLNYNIDLATLGKEIAHNLPIYIIIQERGEGIFVPSGWHHQVWNLEDAISINHNWINGCNVHFVWKSLKENLEAVKKEISDCRDMDEWSLHCQKILSSSFGFDYRFFYSFLVHIVRTRANSLKQNERLSVIGNWDLGENHVKFDLKQALLALKTLEEDDDFAEVVESDKNLNHSFECLDSLSNFVNC